MKKTILKFFTVLVLLVIIVQPLTANAIVKPIEKLPLLVAAITYPNYIDLNTYSISLKVGQEATIKATLTYPDAVNSSQYENTVFWELGGIVHQVSSPTVTINTSTIKIYADSPGTTTVTARSFNGLTATCYINVSSTTQPTPTPTPQPGYKPVTLYKDINFQGSSLSFSVGGLCNSSAMRETSSVKVDPGYRVTLCDALEYKGNSLLLSGDNFLGGNCSDLRTYNFNDKIQSIMVEKISDDPKCPVVYQLPGYVGKSQELSVGSYRMSDLTVGNDKISSIKVPAGWKVTLYEHDGFTGISTLATLDRIYLGDKYSNMTSSIKVERLY